MAKQNTLVLVLVLLVLSTVTFFFLLHRQPLGTPPATNVSVVRTATSGGGTNPSHLVFGIAAASKTFHSRHKYIRLWANSLPSLRGFVFVDSFPNSTTAAASNVAFPLVLSSDSSRFPFTHPHGLRSAVRIARVVKDLLAELEDGDEEFRWLVAGDDDTIFFPENVAAVLRKYDWREWWYVGGRSEVVAQNAWHSFDMAFGGGGFAVSAPLARALAETIDGCIGKYAYMYGGDQRVSACLAELGVGLTHEPGFHQVDIRGNIFGYLSAHPLTPLLSLHHMDFVDPIFPGVDRIDALTHLVEAAKFDQGRILQQTVCYDPRMLLTISVSWGYAIQVFEGNQVIVEVLLRKRTFTTWSNSRANANDYMFGTREFPKDPCKQPIVFFFQNLYLDEEGIWTIYKRHGTNKCHRPSNNSTNSLKEIKVLSQKLDLQNEQPLRRHCCDVSNFTETLLLNIRKCIGTEVIAMQL